MEQEDWSQKDIAVAQGRSYESLKHGKYRRAGGEGTDSRGFRRIDQQDQVVSWF